MFDLKLENGTLVLPGGIVKGDLLVHKGRIERIHPEPETQATKVIDCSGLHILPGVIDSQVHFREPGLEQKEDLETGSKSAVAGGVCTFFEMPNTNPSTTTPEALNDKLERASKKSYSNYAFFCGGTPEKKDWSDLERLPGCVGIKIFMGSSTGNLLVDEQDALRYILQRTRRRVAVHCEDETRLKERKHMAIEGAHPSFHPVWRDEQTAFLATKRLLDICRETGARVHVLHVTTKQEMQLLGEYKDVATVEVTPQHLTLSSPDCYEKLGSFAQMNPPIRSKDHQDALWYGIEQGIVDVIGSDHAPHLKEEKARTYPGSPSGMPGVQTLLPVMLNHVNEGRLSLLRLVDLLCYGPTRLYGIRSRSRIALGYHADLSIVDLNQTREIQDEMMHSRCGWTPFHGQRVKGFPTHTIVNGQLVMERDQINETGRYGNTVEFDQCYGS